MSGPPFAPNSSVDDAGKSPVVPPHTRSAPPTTTVYSGAFFSGAHHFDIQGGEFSSAQTMHKTIHNDNSYRSNFNNTRNDDYRGSTHYSTNYQGDYSDNRNYRSQNTRLGYNNMAYSSGRSGRGRGYYDDYDDYGDEEYSYNRGYSQRGRGQNRVRYGPGPDFSRWRDDDSDEPRMIESREAIRQRDRNQGFGFDDLYSQDSFSSPRRTNRSNSEREPELEPISSSRAAAPYREEPKSYAYDLDQDDEEGWQGQGQRRQQRRPTYGPRSSGFGSGPGPSSGDDDADAYPIPSSSSSPRTTGFAGPPRANTNPFRAASVPNPISRPMSGTSAAGPSPGSGPNPRTPWTTPRGAGAGVGAGTGTGRGPPPPAPHPQQLPRRGMTIQEVEDVEMRGPGSDGDGYGYGDGEGEGDEDEGREHPSTLRRFPRAEPPTRSFTTGP